jgi:hypothetical protein
MADNKPAGDNARKGAVKRRSRTKNTMGGTATWTKRNGVRKVHGHQEDQESTEENGGGKKKSPRKRPWPKSSKVSVGKKVSRRMRFPCYGLTGLLPRPSQFPWLAAHTPQPPPPVGFGFPHPVLRPQAASPDWPTDGAWRGQFRCHGPPATLPAIAMDKASRSMTPFRRKPFTVSIDRSAGLQRPAFQALP